LGAQEMVQMDDFLGALEGARGNRTARDGRGRFATASRGNFCGVEGRARSRGV
jgi:hypothetical protein